MQTQRAPHDRPSNRSAGSITVLCSIFSVIGPSASSNSCGWQLQGSGKSPVASTRGVILPARRAASNWKTSLCRTRAMAPFPCFPAMMCQIIRHMHVRKCCCNCSSSKRQRDGPKHARLSSSPFLTHQDIFCIILISNCTYQPKQCVR